MSSSLFSGFSLKNFSLSESLGHRAGITLVNVLFHLGVQLPLFAHDFVLELDEVVEVHLPDLDKSSIDLEAVSWVILENVFPVLSLEGNLSQV